MGCVADVTAGRADQATEAMTKSGCRFARPFKHVELQGGGGQHAELSGYHAKRHEFEPEYDQDAELMVAELEFRDADTQVGSVPPSACMSLESQSSSSARGCAIAKRRLPFPLVLLFWQSWVFL